MKKTSKKITVVIADDDEDLQLMYSEAFTAAGFEVLSAKNGAEVLEWLSRKNGEIKVVLLDIVMPKMDGFEVLEEMMKNEEYKRIPVLVASNLDSDADRRESFALGAKDYFEKAKWTPAQIVTKVTALLGA